LTALRVLTGLVFIEMGTTHALGGWATAEGFRQGIGRFASGDPLQWYTAVMVPVVLGAPGLFGPLFAFGMVATGVALVLGVLTRPAIVAGLWLNANNLLMGFGGGGVHHGINALMATVQLAVWHTGAWRSYSLDGLLAAPRRRAEATRPGRSLATRDA
jgi:thiosulfate dehydrogenase [quinone] large subunit